MKIWARKPTTAPTLTGERRTNAVEQAMPVSVVVAADWSWRFLVVAAATVVVGYVIITLHEITVPFMIALLLAALLTPFVNLLRRHHFPHWLAIVVALLITIIVVAGLVFLVVSQVRAGLPGLEKRSVTSYNNFKAFLRTSPAQLTNADINNYLEKGVKLAQKDSQKLFSGALTVGATVGKLFAGALITLFSTIFLLIDGSGVWRWVTNLFPRRARLAGDGAGKAGWLTLTVFVRVQLLVAGADAIGVGLFAFFLGLPLYFPVAILVFLASFVPVVGAVASGAIAVVIALVYVGPLQALIMLGGVLIVHLLEAHILQPLVMGNAVKVHPLAVVLSVAGGSFLAGIPGALFAVPVVAVLHVIITFIARGDWKHEPNRSAETQAAATVTPQA